MPRKQSSYLLEEIRNSKKEYIIGVDECGTGALAGEVYVCAFFAPKDWYLKGVADSKAISKKKRETVFEELFLLFNKKEIDFSFASAHPNNKEEYKEYGDNLHSLLKYLYWKSAQRLLSRHPKQSTLIVLDGIIEFPTHPYALAEAISLPKADALIPQVSAASIIAKHSRDAYMQDLHQKYPQYEWDKNVGYPSPAHKAAIKKYGICKEHRMSYKTVREHLQ